MRMLAILAAIGVAGQSHSVAAADDPIVLPATSPWHLSYDKQGCALVRKFGEGDQAVVVRFSKYRPGTSIDAILVGTMLEPEGYSFEAGFMPGDEPYEHEHAMYGKGETGTSWQFSTGLIPHREFEDLIEADPVDQELLARREKERAAQVTKFAVTDGVEQPVTLELGSMVEPMAAMDVCLDDLLESWGFDPAVQRNLRLGPEPTNKPERWIRSSDYPREALRKGISGRVRFRIDISASGDVTACTIQSATSDPAFEQTTCEQVMKRARYSPALDASGNAVASYWAETVVYLNSR